MVCQPLRLALLIGAITAVAVSPVRANGFRAPRCCDPCGSSSSTTGPAYRSNGGSGCYEWVRENVQEKRTVYRYECRTEQYDTFRCERVPVCRERTVTCVKRVPVWTEQCRKVCVKETVWETRMVNKTCYKTVQETCMKKQLVRLGHWECREVQPLFGHGGGGGGLFSGRGHGHHGNGCNDPCANNNGCNDVCRPTRTKQVWVHCPEYRECPVTVCKKVCYTECVPCKVAVCKNVWREEKVKVCTYQCVTEQRVVKCTEWETRRVPCKATRTVRVCVPCEEMVNVCRMVRREVAPAPAAPCAQPCTNACNDTCRPGLFSRFHNRDRGCNDGCGNGGHHGGRDCCR
jgi:hypothetical protein